MGRRKIEIRPIKDDRNRSVTFLKRKGGLFKKAHELSVLCSVDVAVIIFGHNRKLYEFSSADINEILTRQRYYGPPHEKKGPLDFRGKSGGDDDDDDDEEGEETMVRSRDGSAQPPSQQLMPPHMQHSGFQHIRQPAVSASPPTHNGMFQHQHRHSTPQAGLISRSNSRNEIRHSTSSIVPMVHPGSAPPPPQGNFAYQPNPSIYNPHAAVQAAIPPPRPSPQPVFQQFQTQQQIHQQVVYHQPPRSVHTPQPQMPQPHQIPHTTAQTETHVHSLRPPSSPERRHQPSKSQSIFTPIDEGGSMLARHFFGPSTTEPKQPTSNERERSPPPNIRPPPRAISQPGSNLQKPQVQSRAQTITSISTEYQPLTRSDTLGSKSGSISRPKLNLTIPSEAEEGEESAQATNQSSSQQTNNAAGNSTGNATNSSNSSSHINSGDRAMLLPPPSPSASALLSAGTTGPGNPFARPAPREQNVSAYNENKVNGHLSHLKDGKPLPLNPNGSATQPNSGDSNGNNPSQTVETPLSALPSRYMGEILQASPGGMFSDWDSWNRGSAVLPSPLTFPTPGGMNIDKAFSGGGTAAGGDRGAQPPILFGRSEDEKRKAAEMDGIEGEGREKRVKT